MRDNLLLLRLLVVERTFSLRYCCFLAPCPRVMLLAANKAEAMASTCVCVPMIAVCGCRPSVHLLMHTHTHMCVQTYVIRARFCYLNPPVQTWSRAKSFHCLLFRVGRVHRDHDVPIYPTEGSAKLPLSSLA